MSMQSAAAQVIQAHSPSYGSRLGPPLTPSPFSSSNQYAIDLAETVFSPEDNNSDVDEQLQQHAATASPHSGSAATLADAVRVRMNRGELVPDALVHAAVSARLSSADCMSRGWVLDGYPRTPAQAAAMLASGPELAPEVVVELHVDDSEALRRVSGRLSAATSSSTPSPSSISLSPRADDADPSAAARRLVDYASHRSGIVAALSDGGARVEVVHAGDGLSRAEIAARVGDMVGTSRRVVLLGKPGSGKSVQGAILMQGADGHGPVHVSAGELLRQWTAVETGLANVAALPSQPHIPYPSQQVQQEQRKQSMLL
jgi:adenylate kinase family enzyme